MKTENEILEEYRAEFENACDDLYYGYGYKFWRKTCRKSMSEEEAKIVWKAAFNNMAKCLS